jgi:hypothetical protein
VSVHEAVCRETCWLDYRLHYAVTRTRTRTYDAFVYSTEYCWAVHCKSANKNTQLFFLSISFSVSKRSLYSILCCFCLLFTLFLWPLEFAALEDCLSYIMAKPAVIMCSCYVTSKIWTSLIAHALHKAHMTTYNGEAVGHPSAELEHWFWWKLVCYVHTKRCLADLDLLHTNQQYPVVYMNPDLNVGFLKKD